MVGIGILSGVAGLVAGLEESMEGDEGVRIEALQGDGFVEGTFGH